MQDFVRLFQAQLLMDVKFGRSEETPRLTDWLQSYAERSIRDKVIPSLASYLTSSKRAV